MRTRIRTGAAVVALAAVAVLVTRMGPARIGHSAWLAFTALGWLAFAVGAWLVTRLPTRTAVVLIVTGAAGLSLLAGIDAPRSSDDMYRYVWDGRVQAAGVDPYRYSPDAPELRRLRDDVLWPEHANWCTDDGCTRINRPSVHTIYPPVAQALFLVVHVLVHAVSPSGGGERPLQLVGALFAVATTLVLLHALRRVGGDPRRAVLWAWCPAVAIEAGNNAHVDVVAVFLAAVGLWLAARAGTRRASAIAGVVLGLAVATKLTPALLVPAVLRRRPVTIVVAVAGAVVAVYLPHVLAVGTAVIGYIPGYLHEEGYADGSRFALLSAVLPAPAVAPAAVAIMAAVALWVLRTADPDRPWRAAATLVGTALVVAAPNYPWYGLLLVMLVAFGGRVEWLAVLPAAYLAQYARDLAMETRTGQRIGYGVALVVLVVGAAIRYRRVGGAGGVGRSVGGTGA